MTSGSFFKEIFFCLTFCEINLFSTRMSDRPSLSLEDCVDAAELERGDFAETWRRDACIYKSILWTLLAAYSDGNCELTHSEVVSEDASGGSLSLAFHVIFFEDSAHDFAGFTKYVEPYFCLIPEALKGAFIVYAGNDETGGVRIQGDLIEPVNAEVVAAQFQASNKPIGIGANSGVAEKMFGVQLMVRESIKTFTASKV